MQQTKDKPYKLAGGKHACSFVRVLCHLAILGLVVCRKLLVMQPQRVGGLDEIVAQILVAGVHHRCIICTELAAFVVFPRDGGKSGQSAVVIETVDPRDLSVGDTALRADLSHAICKHIRAARIVGEVDLLRRDRCVFENESRRNAVEVNVQADK